MFLISNLKINLFSEAKLHLIAIFVLITMISWASHPNLRSNGIYICYRKLNIRKKNSRILQCIINETICIVICQYALLNWVIETEYLIEIRSGVIVYYLKINNIKDYFAAKNPNMCLELRGPFWDKLNLLNKFSQFIFKYFLVYIVDIYLPLLWYHKNWIQRNYYKLNIT